MSTLLSEILQENETTPAFVSASKQCNCHQCVAARQQNSNSILNEILDFQLPTKFEGDKLKRKEKRSLRAQALRGRDDIPGWKARCAEIERRTKKPCEIHHVIPLQYTHLFRQNPNKGHNLLLLTKRQHDKIHSLLRIELEKVRKEVLKRHPAYEKDLNIEQRKVLVKFKKLLMKKHNNAAVPDHLKNQVVKEILQELELSGIYLNEL